MNELNDLNFWIHSQDIASMSSVCVDVTSLVWQPNPDSRTRRLCLHTHLRETYRDSRSTANKRSRGGRKAVLACVKTAMWFEYYEMGQVMESRII